MRYLLSSLSSLFLFLCLALLVSSRGTAKEPKFATQVGTDKAQNQELKSVEIHIPGPEGLKVTVRGDDGKYGPSSIEAPERLKLAPGRTYRFKLSEIPDHVGGEIYPSLELRKSDAASQAVLREKPIPLFFTEQDFTRAFDGTELVTKVLVLPNARTQGKLKPAAKDSPFAVLTSTDHPDADVLAKAAEYGTIVAVLRLGNLDFEVPKSQAVGDDTGRTQLRVLRPESMTIQMKTLTGKAIQTDKVPCRFGLDLGETFRFVIDEVPNRPKLALTGTVELRKSEKRSESFLQNACIPVTFPEEYLDDLAAGKSLTFLITLPGPKDRQDLKRDVLLKSPVLQTKLMADASADEAVKEQSKERAVLAVVKIKPAVK